MNLKRQDGEMINKSPSHKLRKYFIIMSTGFQFKRNLQKLIVFNHVLLQTKAGAYERHGGEGGLFVLEVVFYI